MRMDDGSPDGDLRYHYVLSVMTDLCILDDNLLGLEGMETSDDISLFVLRCFYPFIFWVCLCGGWIYNHLFLQKQEQFIPMISHNKQSAHV